MASTKQRELEQSKQHLKGSHKNRNIVEKKRKMDVQPNNRPSSLLGILFTSGKSTNFSFIVLSSWFEFCPKIDISVK